MSDDPGKCEECRKDFKVGERVVFVNRYGAPGFYRFWHPKCFDEGIRPLPTLTKYPAKK